MEAVNSTFNCFIAGCADVTGFCSANGVCICRTGFTGNNCAVFNYERSEGTWIYFFFQLIFFSLVFAAILIWAITEIILLVRKANGNIKEVNKYTLQIYIAIGFLGFVVGNILLGLGISTYIFIQLAIAYIWIDAYLHTKPNSSKMIRILQGRIILVRILTVLVQLTRDVLVSLPQLPTDAIRGYQTFYFCYLFVVGTTTAISLLVAGYRVKKQLNKFKDVDKSRKRIIKRLNTLAITSSILLLFVVLLLVGFIVVTFSNGTEHFEDFFIFSNSVMRAVEATYCLTVLGVYRTRVLAPKSSSTSNKTSNPTTGQIEMSKETKTMIVN